MILFRKALRSMWASRRAYLSCVGLIAVGIMTFTAFHSVFLGLRGSQTAYYEAQRFADVFAEVRAMPRDRLARVGEVPGVAAYSARLRQELEVLGDGAGEAARLLLHTYDAGDTEPVNGFILTEGSRARGGLVLGADFALANGLRVGDSIALNLAGRAVSVPICGLANSPEFIYHVRSLYDMLPNPATYGYAYMDSRDLAPLLGRSGEVNHLGILLEPGVLFEDVRYPLEDALAPYGLTALTERKDQISHSMLDTELKSIGSMAEALPLIFIGMSVIMLTIMLRRIIEQERTQIGILKAYGHSNAQVIAHYLCYGAAAGLAGGLLGDLLGFGLAEGMYAIYSEYFKLPRGDVGLDPLYAAAGVALAVASGAGGAFFGAARVLRLSPGEAMRPAAPPPVRFDFLGRVRLLGMLLASSGRMALRSIDRGRFRSAFVSLGVCFAFAVMAVMASFTSMFDMLLLDRFNKMEVYDLKLGLTSQADYTGALESSWRLPGVSAAEGILELPAEFGLEHRNTGAVLTGIEADAALYRLYDSGDMAFRPLPQGGVVLSNTYADTLRASVGDLVRVKSPYLPEEVFLPVLGVLHQNMGAGCYLTLDTLWSAMQSGPVVSGVLLKSGDPDGVSRALAGAEQVASLARQRDVVARYEGFLNAYMPMMNGMQLIGIFIAFAIINTTSSISLGERRREYATLRVLGMRPAEVGGMMSFESSLLSAVGMVLGVPLTYWLKMGMTAMMVPEMFTIPLYTEPAAFLTAAVGCMAAVYLAGRSMRRQVAAFDLIDVLKERE